MNYLFVTIKRVGSSKPTFEHYQNYLNRLNEILSWEEDQTICRYELETDSNDRLHLHMIMHVNKDFNWNTLKIYKKGWHIHTLKINSHEELQKVNSYLDKEDRNLFNEFYTLLMTGEYMFQS